MQKLAGVTLLVVISKIFNKIILERIKDMQREAYGRNRRDFATTDRVLIRSIH